jgi:DNA-binding NtrC family response regulator
MQLTPVKIIIIHDDISIGSPIMITLEVIYGKENVILYNHSNVGLDYVLSNLGQKMVVLLDKNFEDKKDIDGLKVFEEIREKTSLVSVILTSVSKLSDFDEDSLNLLVNNELFGYINFTSDYSKIVSLINKAVDNMQLRIDCVIEEWIIKHPSEKRNQPLVKMKDGRNYTMDEVLDSIRKQTSVGIDFEKSLLNLSIELFGRQKLKFND